MKLEEYLKVIERFLKDKLVETKMSGYVLGVSGGIDSALVLALAKRAVGEKIFGLIMPCESHESDANDAIELLEKFNVEYITVDLTSTFQKMAIELEKSYGHPLDKMARANIKVRLRMVTLYAIGQTRNSLVLGTDNLDEAYTGYFTKYGDGGVDLLPIAELTKSEVFEASRILGVTEAILNRKPSAGLFVGQTDEMELGVTYEELDNYLLGKEVPESVKVRIEHLHKVSAHKREPIPKPTKFIRD
ncbi:MAG: NAD(+) synthase [Erysipelotrichales bacterium]|nr:NAD(+) synthase [Erysipelotrichales bacterium]